MASTSASTDYKYEVFLSFRGEDTRNSFTDHLYNALCQAGIRTFRVDDAILEGHELRHEITRSIRKSRGSIIVISKNFARSRWCLEELYLILKQKKKGDHFLLPVFYDVEPSDIRSRRGSFRIRAREGTKWTEDYVNRWKAALEEVGNLKGMIVSGPESLCIENIVKKVYRRLGWEFRGVPVYVTGMIVKLKRVIIG